MPANRLDPDYVEAILVLRDPNSSKTVVQWLASHNLHCRSMQVGFLIFGELQAFEEAFSEELRHAKPPVQFTVPTELAHAVSSIVIPPIREIQ